jgi:glycosyltransferase involved in cell wall biosynthesis
MLNIVHFSTTDTLGGAAQATYKLHKELLKQGLHSTLFVRNIVSTKPESVKILRRVDTLYENKIKPRIQKYVYKQLKAKYEIPKHIPFSWNTYLPKYNISIKEIEEADIVSLYWIGEFLSPKIIANFKQPIVWRLSDIWPFSGGCHYPGSCTNYSSGCGNCHYLKHPSHNDFTKKLNKLKYELWKPLDITIAAPSNWIAELAAQSTIFQNRTIQVIKTGVDHHHFKPIEKSTLREVFNISKDKILILFGANSANDDRKGIKYLIEALSYFPKQDRKDIALGIFGGNYHQSIDDMGFDIHYFGYVNETFLPIIYNLSDIFIAPSLEENLPNTVIEAMACGVPPISFRVGGLPDLIEHGKNGSLAIPKDASDLYQCIQYSLLNKEKLGFEARKTIIDEFTQEKQAREYISLYKSILNK